MPNHRIFRCSPPTFRVTWVKAGTSSVFGLESLRELRVQGAAGMGNGFGPSLTHGGRKVVLCGGWPPAPGILVQSSLCSGGMSLILLHPREQRCRWLRSRSFNRLVVRGTRWSTLFSDDDLPEDVRDALLTDSWTGRTAIGGDYAWARSTSRGTVSSRDQEFQNRNRTLLKGDPRRCATVDIRHRDAERLPRSRVSLSLSFSWREIADHDGVGNFCASSGKIETWTAQQADCTSPTVRYFRPCDVIERREPEIERWSSSPLGHPRRGLHRLGFASSTSYDAFRVCLRCNRSRLATKVDRSSGSVKS